jgi:hypothetical protein
MKTVIYTEVDVVALKKTHTIMCLLLAFKIKIQIICIMIMITVKTTNCMGQPAS